MNPIQVPLKMRVWAAVRNRPGSSVQEILAYLKTDKRTSVSSALSVLEFNEVVYSTGDGVKGSPKKYFTELDIYNPIQASHGNYRKSIMNPENLKNGGTKSLVKPTETVLANREVQKDKIEALFDTLTLNECRDLYQRLHTIFG